MKKLVLTLSVLALAAPSLQAQGRARGGGGGAAMAQEISYKAPRPDAALSCQCNELQRRIAGLDALSAVGKVGSFAQRFPEESRKLGSSQAAVSSAVGDARAHLDNAKGRGWADQERMCGEAISKTNDAWGQWQAFLSQQGIDSEYYRGVKVDHPTIPKEGDLSDNGKGRVCKPGQWWEEDRALWAITAREGLCEQSRYQVKQILAGGKGDPGFRCFEYELK